MLLLLVSAVAAQEEGMTEDSMAAAVQLEPPPAPENIQAEDMPNDGGHKLTLTWDYPAAWSDSIAKFLVYRSYSRDGEYRQLGQAPGGVTSYLDIGNKIKQGSDYMPNDVDNRSLQSEGRSRRAVSGFTGARFRFLLVWFSSGSSQFTSSVSPGKARTSM
jgi:hypothetical protein